MAAIQVTTANTNSLLNARRSVFRDSLRIPHVLSFTGTTIQVSKGVIAINESGGFTSSLYTSSIVAKAQSFTGNGAVVTVAQFSVSKTGSPTGYLVAKIYAHSGTFGTSSVPTGSPLATSGTIDLSTITGTLVLRQFNFQTPVTITNGTNYVIALEYVSTFSNGTNYVNITRTTPSTVDGNESSYISNWVANSSYDLSFYLYGSIPGSFLPYNLSSAGTIISAVSGAIDSNNILHICWLDDIGASSDLKYNTFNTLTNVFGTTVSINTDIGSDPTAANLYTSIAVDANNIPHIAVSLYPSISGAATYNVAYQNRIGGAWNAAVNIRNTKNENCSGHQISINVDNIPVVTYLFGSSLFACLGNTNNATTFTSVTVDTDALNAGTAAYQAITTNGDIYCCKQTTSHVFELYKKTYGATWTDAWTVYTKSLGVAWSSISLTAFGNKVCIIGEDNNNDVSYFSFDGTTFSDVTVLETGTFNSIKSNGGSWVDYNSAGQNTRGDVIFIAATTPSSTGLSDTFTAVSQSITGNGKPLESVYFVILKEGTPTGNAYAKLYAHSGTFGTDSAPTGAALATSNAVAASSFPPIASGLMNYGRFVFATPYTLENGVNYCMVIEHLNSTSVNFLYMYFTAANPAGNSAYFINNTWTPTTADFAAMAVTTNVISQEEIDYIFLDETATPDVWWNNLILTASVAWLTKLLKWYNGSSWVSKPLKYYNGSSWVTKPTKINM